jgi:tight adherence protein B
VIEFFKSLGPEALIGLAVAVGTIALFAVAAVIAYWGRRASNIRRFGVPDPDEPGILPRPYEGRGNETLDQKFETMVSQSGTGFTPEVALAFMLFVGVGAAAVAYLWREDFGTPALALAVGLLVPLAGFLLAHMSFRKKMRKQLPDLLYLTARSVRAGLSLPQAIAFAGTRGQKPLADEFKRAAQQMDLGLTPPAALRQAARRVRMVDFDALVSTVEVYTTTGGNLPLMMERLAAAARDHDQFRGHFLAATAQGRLTALIIGLAGPALLTYYMIAKPDYTTAFFADPRAYWILAIAGLLQVIGIVWLYRLLKVDY